MKIINDLANDTIDTVYNIYKHENNKSKLDDMVNSLFIMFFEKIKPYFILLTVLLITNVILNSVQFYYYIKIVVKHMSNQNTVKAEIIKDLMN